MKRSRVLSNMNAKTITTSNNAHIISSSHFKMEIVQPKQYDRKSYQQTAAIPDPKGKETSSYVFQWLVFKPQAHAVEPFETNRPSRNDNTQRNGDSKK